MFHGLEDIRLYLENGTIRFIASTVNYSVSGKNRMVTGIYNIEGEHTFRNCEEIEPPTDTFREKNWIPFLPKNQTQTYFIYRWTPFQIGVIENRKLRIVLERKSIFPPNMEIRGSSNFCWTSGGYVGVVHFSVENTLPKQYYHMLVLLDEKEYVPIRYSRHFCFRNYGIEFCLHLKLLENAYSFWFTSEDRNPTCLEVPFLNIPW